MAADSEDTRQRFRRYIEEHGDVGPVGELASRLARGELTPAAFDAIVGARPPTWLKPALLDLLLFYLGGVLSDHRLSIDEQRTIRELKLLFRVREGEFLRHRRAEIAVLLADQLERMLADHQIDDTEALQQVELQRAFDLSYDEFLALTRPAVEAEIGRLVDLLEATSSHRAEVMRASSQLEALRTVYLLSSTQPRRSGHRY